MSLLMIFLLIALHLNGILFCMEIKPSHNLNLKLLKTMPLEIVQHITRFAAPSQWWYLNETFKNRNWWVYGIRFDDHGKLLEITDLYPYSPRIPHLHEKKFDCLTDNYLIPRFGYFDSSERQFITTLSGKVVGFDSITHEQTQTALFEHPDWVHSICLDSSKKFLATGSQDCKARIFNMETRQEMYSFKCKHYINSVCFNDSGKLLATVSGNRTIHIFDQYDDYTLWQLILKHTLHTWLLIKKPNKKINTVEKLFKKVSLTCDISYDELITIWSTFPEIMQKAIWNTMHYKIQKYGKKRFFIL
jgi:WD40 repeat protein